MKYEYTILEFESVAGQMEHVNEMGDLGWELVAVANNPEKSGMVLYFKRPTLK